jgi:hypothetical protein
LNADTGAGAVVFRLVEASEVIEGLATTRAEFERLQQLLFRLVEAPPREVDVRRFVLRHAIRGAKQFRVAHRRVADEVEEQVPIGFAQEPLVIVLRTRDVVPQQLAVFRFLQGLYGIKLAQAPDQHPFCLGAVAERLKDRVLDLPLAIRLPEIPGRVRRGQQRAGAVAVFLEKGRHVRLDLGVLLFGRQLRVRVDGRPVAPVDVADPGRPRCPLVDQTAGRRRGPRPPGRPAA